MSHWISAVCTKCLRNRLSAELGITVMFGTKCQPSGTANKRSEDVELFLNRVQMKLHETRTVKCSDVTEMPLALNSTQCFLKLQCLSEFNSMNRVTNQSSWLRGQHLKLIKRNCIIRSAIKQTFRMKRLINATERLFTTGTNMALGLSNQRTALSTVVSTHQDAWRREIWCPMQNKKKKLRQTEQINWFPVWFTVKGSLTCHSKQQTSVSSVYLNWFSWVQ